MTSDDSGTDLTSDAVERYRDELSLFELYGLHEGDDVVAEMRDAVESAKERSRDEVARLRRRDSTGN